MTKKTKKQVRFEFDLMCMVAWVKHMAEHEEALFSEPERLKNDLYILDYKLKTLVDSYPEIRKHTLSPVAEFMWKDIQNDLNNLYKEQEE